MKADEMYLVAMKIAALPDDTEPNNWEVRKEVLGAQGFHLWAAVCALAFQMTNSGVIKSLSLIELVNALRRMPGLWPIETARTRLDEAWAMANSLLARHPRVNRLRELILYHMGWVAQEAGDFGVAADCHRRSIPYATSDLGRAIAVENAAFMDLMAALVRGAATEELQRLMTEFEREARAVAALCTDGSDNALAWLSNTAYHILFWRPVAQLLPPDDADVLIGHVQSFAIGKSTSAHVLMVVEAFAALARSDYAGALRILEAADALPDQQAMNPLLIRAWAQDDRGDESGARSTFGELIHRSKLTHGTHVARTIAERELAKMQPAT